MERNGVKYEFLARAYPYSTSADMVGWTIVSLPKEMSVEIRNNYKHLEEGWGRMKVTAKIGNSEWQTAIWFDTKLDTHFLPIKATIRKEEKVTLDKDVKIAIWIL